MSAEERNKAIIQQVYAELFDQGKLALAEELFAPDYIDYEAPPGLPNRGPEAMRQLVMLFHNAFPDVYHTIEELVAEGETVAAYVTWSGTHRESFLGIAPTGRVIRQRQMHFIRLRDGQLVEHRAVRDDLGLMQQLGAIAAPPDKP
jgi:steroid delta-isomerase-like uncharacterized protein